MFSQENDIVALGVMLRPGVNLDIDLESDEHLVQPVDLDPGLSLALWTLCGGWTRRRLGRRLTLLRRLSGVGLRS